MTGLKTLIKGLRILFAVAALLVLWQVAIVAFNIPSYILPPPAEVGKAFVTSRASLTEHAVFTVVSALVGLGVSCSLAVALAIAFVTYKPIARLSMPLVIAFRSSPVTAVAPLIMLFVGRVHPEKGVRLLVDGFAKGAQAAFAGWKLMIVGPTETKLGGGGETYLDSLRRSAQSAKNKINFAGPIFDLAKLANVYRNARLFVYPSLSERGESFGLAPLEAMTHGCAVIVSDLGCFKDFIRDNETGFIFDHRKDSAADSLRKRMESAIANESSLSRVAEAGHCKSTEYSAAGVADQFLADFERVRAQQD